MTIDINLIVFLENIAVNFKSFALTMLLTLRPNEQLIKIARQHAMFLMPVFFSWPLVIIGLLAARYALNFNFFGYWAWTVAIAVLSVFLIILYKYYIWRSNALIITSQRIVENEQHGFFSKTVTELLYRDILEVSYDKKGISASMYDYGDLKIMTAAENKIVLEKIAKPDETVELINKIRQTPMSAI